MKRYWNWLFYNQPLLYKGFLFLTLCGAILYLFPKGGKFQYEFQKGFPWKHATLYAPFDFPILKTKAELEREITLLEEEANSYYRVDTLVEAQGKEHYQQKFERYFSTLDTPKATAIKKEGEQVLDRVFQQGILPLNWDNDAIETLRLIDGNTEKERFITSFFQMEAMQNSLQPLLSDSLAPFEENFYKLFFEVLAPNIVQDSIFKQKILNEGKQRLSPTRGLIKKGSLIIAQNELVDGERYQRLASLAAEYRSSSWTDRKEFMIATGYAILIGLALFMLLRFILIYREKLFNNNKELTFIFFNVFLIVALTVVVLNFDPYLVYSVPICILPLTLKAFFDARLGLFTHVLTVLLLGFIVPNSFEFVFLQMLAGIVTIQSSTKLYQRANLFISVGQIVLIYLVVHISFAFIHEGSIKNIALTTLGLFLLNGLLTLFVQPLIYLFERLFSLTSDVSLLELSDTNTALLKELSDQAPGTFHHSLQVANLAEAAASHIGANTLLVRVGALYHDIGKMKNPTYFSENQKSEISPHHELNPQQSASIIIHHVREGIALAKKHKLPERIIDFIRTHHGSSVVYYFYKQAQEQSSNHSIDSKDFRYPGPKPFSKETAILMMADAVEAASKSLKNPNLSKIETFVQQIIQKQLEEGQFSNSNITLSEIEEIKKVLIRKLSNIYHLRIEYPE